MFDRTPINTVNYASSTINNQNNVSGVRINVTDGAVTNAQEAGISVKAALNQQALCRPMITILNSHYSTLLNRNSRKSGIPHPALPSSYIETFENSPLILYLEKKIICTPHFAYRFFFCSWYSYSVAVHLTRCPNRTVRSQRRLPEFPMPIRIK